MSEDSSYTPQPELETRLGQLPEGLEPVVTPEAHVPIGLEFSRLAIENGTAVVENNDELVEGLIEGEKQLVTLLSAGQDVLSYLKIQQLTRQEAVLQLQDIAQKVAEIAEHQWVAFDEQLRKDVQKFLAEVSLTRDDAFRRYKEVGLDDDVQYMLSKTEECADEMLGSVRSMELFHKERQQALDSLMRHLATLEREAQGAEATAAQVGKTLADALDASNYQYRAATNIQSELDRIRRLHKSFSVAKLGAEAEE